MAEIYPLGKNRIFYRPQGFVEGLTVTVDMIDPDLQDDDGVELTEFRAGLYYFDYYFSIEGTYIGIFYEDGKKRTSQAFSTRKLPARVDVTEGGFRPFLGDNVVNT